MNYSILIKFISIVTSKHHDLVWLRNYFHVKKKTRFIFSTKLNPINMSTYLFTHFYINFKNFIRNCLFLIRKWIRFEPVNKTFQYSRQEKVRWCQVWWSRWSRNCSTLFNPPQSPLKKRRYFCVVLHFAERGSSHIIRNLLFHEFIYWIFCRIFLE